MKSLLFLLLILSILDAQERPKIALVLSGGGARGGAHVGVLKVLEEKKIPIDLIVGTSMGAFVGGLYASGKTPQEIEDVLLLSDWKKFIRVDFNRADTPMRKKEIEYTYQGKMGIGINSDYDVVLPTGVFKRQPMLLKFLKETQHAEDIKDFDNLPIPFRAVATDIKNGETIVLKSGSLGKSIYASSSIPGGFQPINLDGLELVDGGVSDNFPIKVAKDLGSDIIIAVDVSENFDKDLDIDSYFVVMGQLVNILMRKNANESIKILDDEDILLTPSLSGISGLDVAKYKDIIQAGEVVAQNSKDLLEKYSLNDQEYEKYKKQHRVQKEHHAPIIDDIEIRNTTYISEQSIRNRLHVLQGKKLDEDKLRADLIHLYNMMIFDSIMYSVKKQNNKNILVISTTPSWDANGEVRFALGLEDDFSGHSAYSLKLGFTLFGLSQYGMEWKNDFEIGKEKKAYSEFFIPFESMQRYYFKPSVEYEKFNNLVPARSIDLESDGSVELNSERYGATLAFGAHVSTDYEFEIGISRFLDELLLDLISPTPFKYKALPIYASFKSDSLDNINFPRIGLKSELVWSKEMKHWGSDYDFEQIYLSLEKPLSVYANNLTVYFKYGSTYHIQGDSALAGNFSLGGLFNLSGYKPYSLNDTNFALGIVKYRYQIKDGGFFGAINTPLYAGFSLEAGDTWGEEHGFEYESIKKSATIYLAADTFLGPFYLAFAQTDTGESSGYLYLGEKF